MSNPYYTNSFAGVTGQTARAEDVNAQFAGAQSGFDGVSADVTRALKGQPAETLNALPVAATRALKWLSFDATGQPLLSPAPYNFRGAWQPTTLYNVGDIVTEAPNNSLYACNTQHTSGATFVGTDWTIFVNLNGLFFASYQIVNGPITQNATAGQSFFANSVSGNVLIQLPTATLGDSPINVTWVAGNLLTGQTLIIQSASGQFIEGTTQTQLQIDTSPASITLAYAGGTYGWKLRTMG